VSCASSRDASAPEVLFGEDRTAEAEPSPISRDEPVSIGFRPPPRGGVPYRLVVEYSGEHETEPDPGSRRAPPARETHLLEIEYRELEARGGQDAILFALDGLHYRQEQDAPRVEREIELGDDRLRTHYNGELVLDLRGAQPQEDLTPRKLLDQIVGSARVDGSGSLIGFQAHGAPPARRFLSELPVARALAYGRTALPEGEVGAGARWRSTRFPMGPAGTLGLPLEIEYTLTGFQELGGVPCAWILFSGGYDGERVKSAAGFEFDQVVASLRGEAFVELETAQVRLLRMDDEIRVVYTIGTPPAPRRAQRLRHRAQLQLERRADGDDPETWTDGSERFGPR
jgi:hypothetical protein